MNAFSASIKQLKVKLTALIVLAPNTKRDRTSCGASLVEYALLITFIALACIAAALFFGNAIASDLHRSGSSIFHP